MARDINISDADAQARIAAGLDYDARDNVTLDTAGQTHLSTSLKGLEKLHIDAVAIAGGGAESELTGLGGINLDLGASGAGALHGAVTDGLPVFSGSDVTLNTDSATINSDIHFSDDVVAMRTAGITELHAAVATTTDGAGITHLDSSLFAGGDTTLASLGGASNTAYAAGMGFEIETGSTNNTHITESQANTLIGDSLHFAEHDHITMDVSQTHLNTSLKDLEKLHVDAVGFAAGSVIAHGNDINLNLFSTGDSVDNLSDVLNAKMPSFDPKANVTLDLDNTASSLTSTSGDLHTLANDPSMVNTLVGHGVDHLAIHEALSIDEEWLHIADITAAANGSLNFEIKVSGSVFDTPTLADEYFHSHDNLTSEYDLSQSALSFDGALTHEGYDLSYNSSDKYGDLIKSLQESGIHDFVVESNNVEITDHLAKALIDAGMLHALPAANLVLDASADHIDIVGQNAARLATSLKSMADLGVDGVQTGTSNSLYIDLGLPAHDPNAMTDISNLLAALDPMNAAKPLAFDAAGKPVHISLILSDDTAADIAKNGGFSATDLEHLSHIGVTNIDVLGDKDDAITTTTTPTPVDSGLVSTTTAATVAAHSPAIPLPDVKVIGTNDPLHGILDPNGLHH